MWILTFTVILMLNINVNDGQLNYGCPQGWESYQDSCYKFVKDDPLIFEEADAACWVDGASLLAIDNYQEHNYISDWLMTHDSLQSLKETKSPGLDGNVINTVFVILDNMAGAPIHAFLEFLFPAVCVILFPSHLALSHIPVVETIISGVRGMTPVAVTIINLQKEIGPSTWYTGGTYHENQLEWNGNTVLLTNDFFGYWVKGVPPPYSSTYIRIAYVIGESVTFKGYGWEVVSPSIKSPYICEIPRKDVLETKINDRGFDYGLGIVDVNDIERGPKIIKEPQGVVIFGEAPDVYIECGASGNPNPEFSWRRDANETVTSLTDTRYTITGGRFTIQDPDQQKDNGLYQCVAGNKFGTVMSNPAEVLFGYLQDFSPVRPEDVRANKFEGTRISCQGPAAYPTARYEWFQWSTEEFIFEDHPHIFVSSSGYLYFSEVQPTDNRKYYCVVTLSAPLIYRTAISQAPSKTSLGVWLIVTGTEQGFSKPFIYTHTFPSPAIRGSRIRLECIAYGGLPLIYNWRREGGQLFRLGTTFKDRNRVIIIENADISDEGNYICTVQGKNGVTEKTINLIIEARPYFPFGIGDKLADPSQSLKWRCKSVARPAAVYTWYKDGQPIKNIPGQVEVRANYLYIASVDASRDEGIYQCGATNVHGTTYSSGQLKVLSFVPNFKRYPLPPLTQIPFGGNFSIPCRVEAAPVPDVMWLKNGNQMSLLAGEISGRVGMSFENDLVFNNIDYSDQGIYTCKATNVNGDAVNTTRVEVIQGISIAQGPMDTRVMVNRTAFLYCQASYNRQNFDLTYVWRFNGYLLNMVEQSHFVMSQKEGRDGLYIRNAQFEHDGIYTCVAQTTLHQDSRSARLQVEGPPAAPAGAYVEETSVTPHTVILVWTVTSSMDHGAPISRYDIEAEIGYYPGEWNTVLTDVPEYQANIEAVNLGLREDQRVATVPDLFPNIAYRFRVRAVNDFGRGQEASKGSVSVKTPSTAPVKPPNNIRGIDDGKVGTLTIVWDALDVSEQCGPGVGYYVYFRKADDPKEYLKVDVPGANSTNYTHLVGMENYYLPYSVKVGAYNIHGAGPNSTEKTVMSAEGMPIATVLMGDCDNYNGTAFSMSWTPVEDTREVMRGRLKGYRIRYWHIDYPELVTWRDLYGQHDSTIIIGLDDNTNYWSSVQVMNYAGVGPIGEIRLAETFHLPPQHYPRHVKVFSHTAHSVKVTWQGVSTAFDEETLQGYILRIWKVQEDIRTATDTIVDKTNEAIIDNLQRHTVYVLRVLGYSIGGDGSLSPHVYFTVDGGNIPFDPTTTQICYEDHSCDHAVASQQLSISLFIAGIIISVILL